MEMVGYVARAPSAHSPTDKNLFIIQLTMIVLAPGIMAAACYMAVGRIILWVTPESHRNFRSLWVPARFITPTFVVFDILAFAIQLLGASILASADVTDTARANKGSHIVQVGLAVQLVCFGFFSFVAARFVFVSRQFRESWPSGDWFRLLYAINIACFIILVRSLYRMGDFSGGTRGYTKTHEWPFWVFDSLLILLVLALFNVIHPADYIPNVGFRQAPKDAEAGHELVEGRN